MPTKRWQARYGGHQIALVNYWAYDLSESWQAIEVDGVERTRRTSSPLLDMQDYVEAEIDTADGPVVISGRLAAGVLGVGGQIYADDVLIGGDRRLRMIDPTQAQRQVQGGFLRFALCYGVPRFGLPFGVAMVLPRVLIDRGDNMTPTLTELAGTFAITAGMFGGLMSVFWYVVYRRIAAQRESA